MLNCWFLGGNNGQRVGQLANERAADKECGQKKKRRNERKLKAVMLGERGRGGGEAVKKWQRMSRYSRGSVREVHNSFSMHSANAKNFPNKWHRSGRIISLPAWLRLGCLCLTAHLTSVSQTLCLCSCSCSFSTSSLRAVILCRTHKLHKQMEREGEGKGREGRGRHGSGCYRPLHMCALFTDHLRRAVGVTNLLLKCGSILRLICH